MAILRNGEARTWKKQQICQMFQRSFKSEVKTLDLDTENEYNMSYKL